MSFSAKALGHVVRIRVATYPHTAKRLHTMHLPPYVSAILVKTFELFWAQKRTGAAGKLLRGLDLNQRPLGYEPNELPDCSTPHWQYTESARSCQIVFFQYFFIRMV